MYLYKMYIINIKKNCRSRCRQIYNKLTLQFSLDVMMRSPLFGLLQY